MSAWANIPTDAVAHALSYCSASTLLRASMVSCELREAAVHAAEQRSPSLGVEHFEQPANQESCPEEVRVALER